MTTWPVVAAAFLLGLAAGALANWAAETLPRWRLERQAAGSHHPPPARAPDPEPGRGDALDSDPTRASADEPSPARGDARGWRAYLHYFTLPWYPFRQGSCPHCGEKRPWRAPALEAATLVLYVAAALIVQGQPLRLAITWLYVWFFLVVLVIDLEHRLVLNMMVGPAAIAALLFSILPGGPGLVPAMTGGIAGLVMFLFFAIVSRGHMGAGDVKLAGVIGLAVGWPAALTALAAGVVLGGVAALLMLVSRRATRKTAIAYAPYLSLGALAVLLRVIG